MSTQHMTKRSVGVLLLFAAMVAVPAPAHAGDSDLHIGAITLLVWTAAGVFAIASMRREPGSGARNRAIIINRSTSQRQALYGVATAQHGYDTCSHGCSVDNTTSKRLIGFVGARGDCS